MPKHLFLVHLLIGVLGPRLNKRCGSEPRLRAGLSFRLLLSVGEMEKFPFKYGRPVNIITCGLHASMKRRQLGLTLYQLSGLTGIAPMKLAEAEVWDEKRWAESVCGHAEVPTNWAERIKTALDAEEKRQARVALRDWSSDWFQDPILTNVIQRILPGLFSKWREALREASGDGRDDITHEILKALNELAGFITPSSALPNHEHCGGEKLHLKSSRRPIPEKPEGLDVHTDSRAGESVLQVGAIGTIFNDGSMQLKVCTPNPEALVYFVEMAAWVREDFLRTQHRQEMEQRVTEAKLAVEKAQRELKEKSEQLAKDVEEAEGELYLAKKALESLDDGK